MRVAAVAALVVSLVIVGVGIGLFLVANGGWVAVTVPPWLTGVFGNPSLELWLPALIAGWLISVISVTALIAWSMIYVWRRRQYESLIARLERELSELRNLPFTAPAPLEDLPEEPSPEAAAVLAFADVDERDQIRRAKAAD
ncbi:MAG: hypothetical protein GY811_27275 [Myxococcales bacterium]|nr:hypothetical protein [Myxococcales bacterium]